MTALRESCSCGAFTEAIEALTAMDFFQTWRREHRCTQPAAQSDPPAMNDQPIVQPAEPHTADLGFRLTPFQPTEDA